MLKHVNYKRGNAQNLEAEHGPCFLLIAVSGGECPENLQLQFSLKSASLRSQLLVCWRISVRFSHVVVVREEIVDSAELVTVRECLAKFRRWI